MNISLKRSKDLTNQQRKNCKKKILQYYENPVFTNEDCRHDVLNKTIPFNERNTFNQVKQTLNECLLTGSAQVIYSSLFTTIKFL